MIEDGKVPAVAFLGRLQIRLQGTGTNAAGCKRLGSSPMASRVWKVPFRRSIARQTQNFSKPKHHNRPPKKKVLVGEQKLLEVSNDAQTKRVPAGVG